MNNHYHLLIETLEKAKRVKSWFISYHPSAQNLIPWRCLSCHLPWDNSINLT
jgi:hypothetical protein